MYSCGSGYVFALWHGCGLTLRNPRENNTCTLMLVAVGACHASDLAFRGSIRLCLRLAPLSRHNGYSIPLPLPTGLRYCTAFRGFSAPFTIPLCTAARETMTYSTRAVFQPFPHVTPDRHIHAVLWECVAHTRYNRRTGESMYFSRYTENFCRASPLFNISGCSPVRGLI